MSLFHSKRWFTCFLLLATSHALAADRPWRMAVTPQYRLISQLNDGDTQRWMRDFDQFILSTSDVMKLNPKALIPLTVVIFDRDKDYTPYKPLGPDGKTARIAGQFIRQRTWGMIGMARDSRTLGQQQILQHEATHWIMGSVQVRQPTWFVEGFAETLSTFERNGDTVNWAKPIDLHIAFLRSNRTMPLSQLLIEPQALFDRENKTELFYAQSWAFTHFLLLSGKPGRREQLSKFLETFSAESGEATVKAVFGSTLNEVETEFRAYIQQPRWIYFKQPIKAAPTPPDLQPAPPAFVEASLGFLALGNDHPDLARTHAENASRLDSAAPDAEALLAYLERKNHEDAKASAHSEEALRRGSKDSQLYVLLADSYTTGPNSDKPNAARMRVNLYERAINLSPFRREIYDRLTLALFDLDKPTEDDAKFLRTGAEGFKGADWLKVGLADVDYKLGHTDVATAGMETALRSDSTLDDQERTYGEKLRARWVAERTGSR